MPRAAPHSLIEETHLMYMIIKNAHLTIITLTFILFLISFVLTLKGSDKVNHKILKIGPHILYTLFALTFIYMVIVNPLKLYPFMNGWASSKLAGFVFYVLSITLALKWAKTTMWRVVGFLSALFWLVMSAKLGFSDHIKIKGARENANLFLDFGQNLLITIC